MVSQRLMLKTFLFISLSLVFGSSMVMAQEPRAGKLLADSVATFELPCLSCDFYNANTIVDRNYDYELLNKKRALEMWSVDVKALCLVSFFGVMLANGILAVNNKWNLWIDIPCATVVGMSTMIPFFIWSRNLKRKADAIEISPTIGYINNDPYLNTAMLSNSTNVSGLSFGVKLKTSF